MLTATINPYAMKLLDSKTHVVKDRAYGVLFLCNCNLGSWGASGSALKPSCIPRADCYVYWRLGYVWG